MHTFEDLGITDVSGIDKLLHYIAAASIGIAGLLLVRLAWAPNHDEVFWSRFLVSDLFVLLLSALVLATRSMVRAHPATTVTVSKPGARSVLRTITTATGWLLVSVFAFVGAVSFLWIATRAYVERPYLPQQPPDALRTIDDFVAWKPESTVAYKVDVRGSQYYLVQGAIARPLASGPAVYTFDAHGNFVDWAPDMYDPPYTPRIVFDTEARRSQITIRELLKETRHAFQDF